MTKLIYSNCEPHRVTIQRGKWAGSHGTVVGRYSDGTYRVAIDGPPGWTETRLASKSFAAA